MSAETINVQRSDDHIDVTLRYRLWVAVPLHERISEAIIRRMYREGSRYMEDHLAIFRNPRCVVAVKQPSSPLWGPCRKPVAPGQDLCLIHGGTSARTSPVSNGTRIKRTRELEVEIERLREQLLDATR